MAGLESLCRETCGSWDCQREAVVWQGSTSRSIQPDSLRFEYRIQNTKPRKYKKIKKLNRQFLFFVFYLLFLFLISLFFLFALMRTSAHTKFASRSIVSFTFTRPKPAFFWTSKRRTFRLTNRRFWLWRSIF